MVDLEELGRTVRDENPLTVVVIRSSANAGHVIRAYIFLLAFGWKRLMSMNYSDTTSHNRGVT
jgi:hypothetical protein